MTKKVIKPRYEVHKLEGTFTKKSYVKDDDGHLEVKETEHELGWMVYFPDGSSIHVEKEAEMQRLGFDKPATLVDMESGDEVGQVGTGSLKSLSEQKTARNKSGRQAAQGAS